MIAAFQRAQPTYAWIPYSETLWDNKYVLFYAKYLVICYESIEN